MSIEFKQLQCARIGLAHMLRAYTLTLAVEFRLFISPSSHVRSVDNLSFPSPYALILPPPGSGSGSSFSLFCV